MALSRKFLSALGIEADKVDEIIEAHTETVNALKEERNQYKADAEKLPGVQKELDDLKDSVANNPDAAYKKQYEDVKKEYDDYKASVEAKETKAKKTEAYRKILQDAKISENRIETVLRVSDVDKLEFDEKGNVKDENNFVAEAAKEWADFVVVEGQEGARTANPPAGNNGGGAGGHQPSRAAELAAKYRQNLYGVEPSKGDQK